MVTKRDGTQEEFKVEKIEKALTNAFLSVKDKDGNTLYKDNKYLHKKVQKIASYIHPEQATSVENIQDALEVLLMQDHYYDVAKAFILYRQEHAEDRFERDRIAYMEEYSQSHDNAASSSETDANANVTMKNVANLEGEVYKTKNRRIQRVRMKDKLNELYPGEGLDKQYIADIEHHIVYPHDEASTPVLKQYCMAVSLYPLMTEGVGNIDGVTPSEPNDLQSFSGQITNLTFLLSSQCKGAVAFGEYFIALNYYITKEYGSIWYEKLDILTTTGHCSQQRTIKDQIYKAFKQFVWNINQPAGNRGYQSPFTNISYYDKTYFNNLFENFRYPDGSKPQWPAIDCLQRLFMKWFNKLRLKQVLTFPVETMAMVHDGTDIIDTAYKDFTAEMYAEGHSFFTYISDSADSLASCCRLKNELGENTFSPTSGLTGVMTGSCNVITLNINRITQDALRNYNATEGYEFGEFEPYLKEYLIRILERVYKYHIAYKTMLYEQEDKKMFAASNGGYIYISKLYSTIGINGLNEAARFLDLDVSNNSEYLQFLQLILGTIKEQNKIHSIKDKKRPFIFNSEVVPAEGLGGKNYRWDKEDGYWVPEDENLYNSYFYNAHDNTSVLDKFILHGRQTYQYTDGGSALHCNLGDHLSKEQYLKLIDIAIKEGTSYFTFNVPNSKCEDCGHIVKKPIDKCPVCGSTNITSYTRVIGYLRPTKAFGNDRQKEAKKRIYSTEI